MTGLPRQKGTIDTTLFTLWGGEGIKNKVDSSCMKLKYLNICFAFYLNFKEKERNRVDQFFSNLHSPHKKLIFPPFLIKGEQGDIKTYTICFFNKQKVFCIIFLLISI